MSRNLRSIALVLVLILGTTTAVQAFPMSPLPRAAEERVDLFGSLLGWLSALFTPPDSGITPVWEHAGSQMDPNGRPRPEVGGTATTDEGSQMDPNG